MEKNSIHEEDEILKVTPEETSNNSENIASKKQTEFVKSYEQIKQQLELIEKKYKKLLNNNVFNDEEQYKLDRLDTISVVLNWVLRNDDTNL